VLTTLSEAHDQGTIVLRRSKNRFANPSAGGWMDCLINFSLPGNQCVCEVQIVHQQLLTVRAELGAHSSYGTYRAAGETLECLGFEGLIDASRLARKRTILKTVLGLLLDGNGDAMAVPKEEELDRLVGVQGWGLFAALPENAWPCHEELVLDGSFKNAAGWRQPKKNSLAASIVAGLSLIGSGGHGKPELSTLVEGLQGVKNQMKEGSEGRAVANVKMSRDTTWYIIHVCNTSPTNRYM